MAGEAIRVWVDGDAPGRQRDGVHAWTATATAGVEVVGGTGRFPNMMGAPLAVGIEG